MFHEAAHLLIVLVQRGSERLKANPSPIDPMIGNESVRDVHHLDEHLAQWVDRRPTVSAESSPESDTFLTTGKKKELSISA